VGGDFENCTHSYSFFKDALEAKKWLQAQNFSHTSILVKGSRGIQMEQVLEA
jgi:UDP-N-acetylmuramyl pentapeptide synthase